jgi:hypothetical protein
MAHHLAVTIALASSMIAAACTVGDPNALPPGTVDSGAVVVDSGGGGDGGNAQCESLATVLPDGHHHVGESCAGAGCHDGGTAGIPRFYLSGTLYTTAAGTTAAAGATILIPNGTGNPLKMIVASNGNFYTESPVTLPARAKASLCPTTVQMTAMVNVPNCNSCHGTANRLHL